MSLKPKQWTRAITLPNQQRALQWIWPAPSDDRVRHGVQAWAVLETTYDEQLRQFTIRVRRMFTRRTGPVDAREMYTLDAKLPTLSWPGGGPGDDHAESEALVRAAAAIAEQLRGEKHPPLEQIFPPGDVLL